MHDRTKLEELVKLLNIPETKATLLRAADDCIPLDFHWRRGKTCTFTDKCQYKKEGECTYLTSRREYERMLVEQ